MEAVLARQSRISPRAALAKPLSAAIAVGTGAPFGAEGPIIVTGGSLGSLLGQLVPVSPSERKILLASGAAAGMAATFGAPLASVVLAIELLLFEFSTRAFVPLVIAASIAGGMHSLLFGPGPLFSVPIHDYAGMRALPAFVVLGLGAGLLAVVMTKGLFAVEGWYRRLPIGDFWHPVIGAVAFGLIGLAVPRALGVGYDVIGDILNSRLAAGTVAVLAVAKLVAWWLALGSGTSGGTLAPILLISAGYGSVAGAGLHQLFPSLTAGPFALVAMAATFGAATRASFASMVFVFELTRDYQVILPLMLATVVADLVAAAILPESIMTEKLSRRGLRVRTDFEVDTLRATSVREMMTTPVETLPDTAAIAEARLALAAGPHGAYPLVDGDGACVGIVARGDLLRLDASVDDREPVRDHASRDVVSVAPDDLVVTVVEVMLNEGVEHVPVLEGGRLVGICTRTDILRARQRQLEHEVLQPGWRFVRSPRAS
jgi:H+/Cl- antiporter ClcA